MQKSKYVNMALIIVTTLFLPLNQSATAEAPAPLLLPQLTKLEMAQLDSFENPRKYAMLQMEKYNWSREQFVCLDEIWTRESHWNYKADNPRSSAYGIAQMLKETSRLPYVQIDNGLRYVEHRYGTPCNAWSFWKKRNWY